MHDTQKRRRGRALRDMMCGSSEATVNRILIGLMMGIDPWVLIKLMVGFDGWVEYFYVWVDRGY